MAKAILDDIAKMAGVSKATVSMALNNYPNITAKTREKVVHCARQLGYLPRQRRRMATAQGQAGNSGTIVFVVAGEHSIESNPYYAGIVSGAMQTVQESGSRMVVCNWTIEDMRRLAPPLELTESAAVGAILAGWCEPSATSWLQGTGIPVVMVDPSTQPGNCDCVGPDNYEAVRIAFQHLRQLGHARIAAVVGSLEHVDWRIRRDAFVALAAGDGIAAQAILSENLSQEGIWDKIRAQIPDVTAVLATWDNGALGLLSALHTRGVRCPQDVSVIGIDGIAAGTLSAPPLTTVNTDQRGMGQLAVLRLLTRMAHPESPMAGITTKASLIQRSSCGAIRRRK